MWCAVGFPLLLNYIAVVASEVKRGQSLIKINTYYDKTAIFCGQCDVPTILIRSVYHEIEVKADI